MSEWFDEDALINTLQNYKNQYLLEAAQRLEWQFRARLLGVGLGISTLWNLLAIYLIWR